MSNELWARPPNRATGKYQRPNPVISRSSCKTLLRQNP